MVTEINSFSPKSDTQKINGKGREKKSVQDASKVIDATYSPSLVQVNEEPIITSSYRIIINYEQHTQWIGLWI